MTTYTPKPGSVAARAVQQLADGPMQAADLSAALGIKRTNLNGNIATAIKAGVLAVDQIDGRAWVRLAKGSAPRAAPATSPIFMACFWDDGCLDIYPTLALDGGGLRLDAAQVERLRCLLSGVPE